MYLRLRTGSDLEMQFLPRRETVTLYRENRTKHTNTHWGQNAQYCNVKVGGTYSYQYVSKGINNE
jgi:hypothetical protein